MTKKMKLLMVLIITLALTTACGEIIDDTNLQPVDNNELFEPDTGDDIPTVE